MTEEKLEVGQATHLLSCRHCVGTGRCRDYDMKCIVLKELGSGKLKLLVFGERGWKHKGHISKIRYVNKDRVRPYNK